VLRSRRVSGPDDFLLVILAGPSGSGKTSLTTRLLDEFQDLTLSISFTTRAPRGREVDGRDYHFVDRARFVQMIERNAFLEWAEVHGNLYGTALERVDAARETHRGMVFDIDYQGARQLRARAGSACVGIFVMPPSLAELERRLRGRGTDAEEVIVRRMQKALHEIEHYALFDHLVLNDDLDRAYEDVRAVVIAERTRRERRAPLAEALLRHGRAQVVAADDAARAAAAPSRRPGGPT
jgi:guanylate kinase